MEISSSILFGWGLAESEIFTVIVIFEAFSMTSREVNFSSPVHLSILISLLESVKKFKNY